VRHLYDPKPETFAGLTKAEIWEKKKSDVARLKIHWDEEKQEYVAGEKAK
jgi:hypothetical protein